MKKSNLTTLRVLLVMSMIGSGMSLLAYLMMACLLPQFREVYEANQNLFPEQFVTAYERMLEIPQRFYAGCTVLYALSLMGVILMWKLRKSGFHCYALAQLLLLLLPVLFLGRAYLGLGDIMFTLLFVASYYLLLKSLGVFAPPEENPTDNQDIP